MKIEEAMRIIEGEPDGFMVNFEHVGDGFLRSDHFPDKHAGEKLIETEAEAWELASRFAAKTWQKCVNIYVINHHFCPVKNYSSREIKNR